MIFFAEFLPASPAYLTDSLTSLLLHWDPLLSIYNYSILYAVIGGDLSAACLIFSADGGAVPITAPISPDAT